MEHLSDHSHLLEIPDLRVCRDKVPCFIVSGSGSHRRVQTLCETVGQGQSFRVVSLATLRVKGATEVLAKTTLEINDTDQLGGVWVQAKHIQSHNS